MAKAKTKIVDEPVVEDNAVTVAPVRCLQWCFLPGISHIGQQGLLQCTLIENHEDEGEEHQVKIDILSPPSGVFTIRWTTGK